MTAFQIRVMTPGDIPQFRRMMATHSEFEGMPDMALTEADLHERAFGPAPEYGAFVADAGALRGLAGFASHYSLPFKNDGRPTLVLKNLWVDPDLRGSGVARALMVAMAQKARAGRYGRMRWSVLPENARAIAFYRSLGATPDPKWVPWLMDEAAFLRLAQEECELVGS
jgi:ribosomal protein S18 acetylase RimI-like enzyme